MLKEERFELGTKSQNLRAEKFLDLAIKLLPQRPTTIDLIDTLVSLKKTQHMWKGILIEHQIDMSINDEFMIDALIHQRFGLPGNVSELNAKRKKRKS